jgi:4-hydroxybutyrate CoA-transferase
LAGKKIIAQLNKHMPRTHGYSAIHMNCFDYIVPNVDEPLPEVKNHDPTPAEQAIGKLISELVPDGACLQMGIGRRDKTI